MLNKHKVSALLSTFCIIISSCNNVPDAQARNLPEITCKDTTHILEDINIDDCIFDTSSYKFTSEALLKYNKDLKFDWNDNDKVATTILENGDTFLLSIGGCNHFGYYGEIRTKSPFYLTDSLFSKARWIARIFFENYFEEYDTYIENGRYKLNKEVSTDSIYFYNIERSDSIPENIILDGFSFEKQGNNTIIKIGGYIN